MNIIKQIKFQRYYQKYFEKIYSYIYFRTGQDRALAEDLAQEIFIKAYEHFDRFDEKAKFSTWIYTICKNSIIDYYRKRKIEKVDLDSAENLEICSKDAKETFIKDTENEMSLKKIKIVIKKIPEKHQEIIILKYFNDLTTKEIAEVINKDTNYVRVNLHRALEKINTILTQEFK